MRLVHWFVTLPAVILLIVFAVSNREPVSLEFWPLPAQLDTRLYLVVLAALFAGFLIGEFVAWINAGRSRRLARERQRRIEVLERELAAAQATLAKPLPPAPARALVAPLRAGEG